MAKQTNILLLEDVYNLGKRGDLAKVKPGYARNYLLPQGKVAIATKQTLRMQQRLQEERAKQSALDLEESKAMATQLAGVQVSKEVKVDPEGHMYGSVAVPELLELLAQSGFTLDKHNIDLAHPVKSLGSHEIPVRLKEGVTCSFTLRVLPEGGEQHATEQAESSEEEEA